MASKYRSYPFYILLLNVSLPLPQGRLQFFARMLVGSVVEYFVYDFELQAEDDPLNATINGTRNDSNVTFTVSLSLMCFPNFYGPNCSVECVPRSSDELGFYTCLSNGSRQCLPDYEGENCTIPIGRYMYVCDSVTVAVQCTLTPTVFRECYERALALHFH